MSTAGQIYDLNIGANQSVRQLTTGTMFKIIACSGALNIKTAKGNFKNLSVGQGFEGEAFDVLEVQDASGSANTVRLLVSGDGFIDGMSGSIAVTSVPAVQSGAFAHTQGNIGVASAQLLAANANRKYLMVQNNDPAATLRLRFGAAATAVLGIRVPPNQYYELTSVQSTQALHALADIATTNVVVVEG